MNERSQQDSGSTDPQCISRGGCMRPEECRRQGMCMRPAVGMESPPDTPPPQHGQTLRFRDLKAKLKSGYLHIEDNLDSVVFDEAEAIALKNWLDEVLK